MKETIAVLGGTGFIGTATVKKLKEAGFAVSVMARNIDDLPALFKDEDVTLCCGDVQHAADVYTAITGATCVVNLAYGGSGSNWEEVYERMVGGAEVVARACLEIGIPLIHVSSIAALYLGKQSAPITGATPTDMHADRRPYARGKALSEKRLQQMQHENGLHLCILRPGLVVGAGTSPLHPAVGLCSNGQDCIGWNAGRNPLPFVLVDDVAGAIVLACTHPTDGKTYNLVGDMRPSAREYFAQLSQILRKPLYFRATNPYALYLTRLMKWSLRRLIGRPATAPSLRDLLSLGLNARFDCSDIKSDLGWHPVADPGVFYHKAFESADQIL
ncbi:MAG TPA: NAD(P)-dependent oxidoreductase [Candidatus Paceibacterota bacterium]|jgi:nucleoside-diphosphate-sugar epimerase|nr:NAD(P)-dependent oxidoreductase [Candidatus Paceibacterota bacterium]